MYSYSKDIHHELIKIMRVSHSTSSGNYSYDVFVGIDDSLKSFGNWCLLQGVILEHARSFQMLKHVKSASMSLTASKVLATAQSGLMEGNRMQNAFQCWFLICGQMSNDPKSCHLRSL